MEYKIRCASISEIDFASVADEFADMNSRDQTIFLYELFSSMKHRCDNNRHLFDSQLLFIVDHVKESSEFSIIKKAVDTLVYGFMKEGRDDL